MRVETTDGETVQTSKPWAYTAGFAIAVGIVLRIAEYLHNKALWLDESYVALSLINRSYPELLETLDYGQGAPLPFLFGVRFLVEHFGPSEYSLRFISLVASVALLPAFYILGRRWLRTETLAISLVILALSQPLIRYASELKPYATDTVVVVALYAVSDFYRNRPGVWRGGCLALAGAASVWCAWPSVFVLGGVGLLLLLRAILDKSYRAVPGLAAIGAVWLASFVVYYTKFLKTIDSNDTVRSWWVDYFAPFPPASLSDANWYVRSFVSLFEDPIGFALPGLGAFVFVLGAVALYRRNPDLFLLLSIPFLFALAASWLERYAFTGRFLMFGAPYIAVFIAEGFVSLRTVTRARYVSILAGGMLVLHPAMAGVRTIAAPRTPQGIRPAFDYVVSNQTRGDGLYLHHWAQFPFRYYARVHDFDLKDAVLGVSSRSDWAYYMTELERLRGSARVWVVFSSVPRELMRQDQQFILTYLDTIGTRLDESVSAESSVYLYDLRSDAARKSPA